MKIQSAKAKGRRLCLKAASDIRDRFELEESDVIVPPSSCPGEDIWLSPHARGLFPFSLEMKNQEKLNVWKAYEQAKRNSHGYTPVVVFSRNNEDIYAMLRWRDLLWSIK